MATNSSSSKPSTFYNNYVKDQHDSLNLNKSCNKPFLIPVQSYSKQFGDKKSYYNNDQTQSNYLDKKHMDNDSVRKDIDPKFVHSWCNNVDNNGRRWKADKKDSKNPNESTISLNISIYENSIEVKTAEPSYCNKVVEKMDVIGKLRAFGVHELFEIPRQQNDAPMEPEMSHFRASQRLLNPNLVNPDQNINQIAPVNNNEHVNRIAPVNSDETVNQIEDEEILQPLESDDEGGGVDDEEDASDDDEEEFSEEGDTNEEGGYNDRDERALDDVDERGGSGEDESFFYGDLLNSVRRRKKKREAISKRGNNVEHVDRNGESLGESSVHLNGQASEIAVVQENGDVAAQEEIVVTKKSRGRPKKNVENVQTKARPGRPKRVADLPDENEVAHLTNLIKNTEEDNNYDMVLLHFNYSSFLIPPSPMADRRLNFSDFFSSVSSDSFTISTEHSFLSPTPVPEITQSTQVATPTFEFNENSQRSPSLQYQNYSYNLTPLGERSTPSSPQQQQQQIMPTKPWLRNTFNNFHSFY